MPSTDKVQQLQQQISDGIAALHQDKQWTALLNLSARMGSRYSTGNTLLIGLQRPDATCVAGYEAWRKAGRQVRRGEHGIYVLAPLVRRRAADTGTTDATADAGGPGEDAVAGHTGVFGFKKVAVFDISQTDGPDIPAATAIGGYTPDGLRDALTARITTFGYRVCYGDCRPAFGVTRRADHTVTILPGQPSAQDALTLAHELGHLACGHLDTDGRYVHRGTAEVEAESVAYILTTAAGMDTTRGVLRLHRHVGQRRPSPDPRHRRYGHPHRTRALARTGPQHRAARRVGKRSSLTPPPWMPGGGRPLPGSPTPGLPTQQGVPTVHHDRTTTSHPCWPALLAAALLGYAARAAVERSLVRQLTAARAEAAHDPLTGLPNRRAAVTEVNTRLAAGPFLLALLDLDDFKTVNDTFGHPTGDDLLAVVAARLYIAVPPDGFVARLAGDEFLILLPDHGGDPADAISPVLTLLAEPARLGAATLRPRASAGVATTAGGAASWRQLIARADQALYRAKHTGDGVAVYHPRLDIPATDDVPRRPRVRRRDHHRSVTATGPDAETGA